MIVLKLLCYIFLLSSVFYNTNVQSSPNKNSISNPQVIPAHIKVGPFFNGQQVIVTAKLPKYSGAIVKLVGKNKEIILNEKGKKMFIWLNVAQVKVKNAPSIYILSSTEELNDLCSEEDKSKELLGYNSLKGRIIFESSLPLKGVEFDEFIKFKENNRYYRIDSKAEIVSDSYGNQILKAILEIPSFISPDEYTIMIYCFKDGYLIDKAVINLSVEEVGLPLFINKLAKDSSAIYGLLAIIVAMLAGSIIGLIFTKKRGSK